MIQSKSPNILRLALYTLITLIIFSFAGVNKASAFQKKAADTVSSTGVQFTDIPTAADSLAARKKAMDSVKKSSTPTPVAASEKPKTLWQVFIAGFLGGFLALLMPCIYPLLPLTVSFFTKRSGNRSKGIMQSAIYGLSIIVIYVSLGLIITLLFGSDALNALATNGIFNLFFFLLLVVFGISFLGAFEITLPSSLANKLDENSDKGGNIGIFFMAATLVVVSFSCTGPIIGSLLVDAASKGDRLAPAIGMFGFSLALALPFTLFALFPSMLKSLPKSGGWLNSVKVVLGFLELAFALKFLSNVDLAYHWHWFDREVFLVLWIVIFALMGFYLLGKLMFSHDSPLPYISVPRLFLAIVVLAFTMYMIPGLWGAPLKSISAFLPPQATQDFDLYSPGGNTNAVNAPVSGQLHKYADLFDKPKGFDAFFDYDEGLAFAKKMHKPVMIDFTGHACVNCRKMEANVWTDKQVYQTINQDYVLIQLYVDDKTDLAQNEQSTTQEGRHIKTIGNKWSYLQTSKFQANSQPFYVLLDPDTQTPLVPPQGANFDPVQYLAYLNSGLTAYHPK